jgi:hypothetical protein
MKTLNAPTVLTPICVASLAGFMLLGLLPTLIAGSMLAGGSL